MSGLSLRNVTVRYRNRCAVDGFQAAIVEGEWLGLIGPNGAGKSSLIKAIAGIERFEGRVKAAGHSPGDRAWPATVAYVPQEPVLPDDMTGFEYVLMGRSPHIGYFGAESSADRSVVERVLGELDLTDFAERHLGQLSGGERQRLVIARALATEASILLLDEPTSALDIGHQQRALELVAELREEHGLTVVAAMHDLTLAGLYSDRLALLDGGVTVAIGAPDEVLTAERVERHYGARVEVSTDADGTVVVTPTRS